jgi:hypothetical protein
MSIASCSHAVTNMTVPLSVPSSAVITTLNHRRIKSGA